MPNPITLNASQVPVPQVRTSALYISDAYSGTVLAPQSESWVAGETAPSIAKFNSNAARIDAASAFGTGIRCVINGLALSAGSGLSINVSAGQANIDGIVELPSGGSVSVPASSPRVHIWLRSDGTLEARDNVLTPPTLPAAYLGSCVTGASSITSLDDSGIVKSVCGVPWRQTADAIPPTDSPGSSIRIFTYCPAGLFFWDGAAYKQLVSAGSLEFLDWKQSVKVATTANGTLSTAFENGDTIDGVVLSTGDRILIKNQTSPAENGVYVVNASGAPTRASDFDSTAEVTAGATIFVEQGTANADTVWTLVTDGAITIGTTPLSFSQLAATVIEKQKTSESDTTKVLKPNGSGGVAFGNIAREDLPKLTVENVTSSGTESGTDTHKVFANAGASSKPTRTLPATAVAGDIRTYVISDADGIRVQANSGQIIRVGNETSKTAGYIESTLMGSVLTLVAISSSEWVATYISGSWTLEIT